MRYELKDKREDKLKFEDLKSGDVFIAKIDGYKFLAMKLICSDNNKYIVDLDDNNAYNSAYTDTKRYIVERLVNGKFVED